jgi:hypothetical protein
VAEVNQGGVVLSSRSKVLLASLAGAAAVAPVALVLAGDNGLGGPVGNQTVAWTSEKAEATKNWKPVPPLGVTSTGDVVSVSVSAQMTKGKAKFRIVPTGGGPAIEPGPVLFSAKAANSFTWATDDTCGQGEQQELQWKRVGKTDAVAAKLSVHNVFNDFCF